MTDSIPVCSVQLIGSPDVDLSYKGGSLDFVDVRTPHVQGTIRVARPASLATLNALDPRLGARIRTTVTTVNPLGAPVTRTFNLGLRERPARLVAGELELSVASDEALLNDYAPLADDLTPFTYQNSIRAIVGYALGKIGAVLAATPAVDASAQTYADSVNLIPDPSLETGSVTANSGVAAACSIDANDAAWAADGAKCWNLYSPTAADSYVDLGGGGGALRLGMTAGATYIFSAAGRVKVAVGGTASAYPRAISIWYRVGTGAYVATASPSIPTAVGTAARVSVQVTLPAGTTEAWVRLHLGHTTGQVQWDALRLSPSTGDPTDTAFFSGATPGTAGYSNAWSGAVNGSTSKRTALLNRPVDAMRWPAGKKALDWLTPIIQAAGYRLLCDEARVWTLRDATYTAAGNLSFRADVNIVDAVETLRRGGDWFDGQVTEYSWIDPATGTRKTAVDSWATSGNPTLVNKVSVDAPFPGPGRSQYAVQRAQQRGREVVVTTGADWTATAEQLLSAVLDGIPIQTGKTSRVAFSLDRDEMTVTTRTTDTPAGAIDLKAGTINSLAGTINAQ